MSGRWNVTTGTLRPCRRALKETHLSTAVNWSGFHKRTPEERLQRVAEHAGLDAAERAALAAASALPFDQADAYIENAVGSFPMPLGFAVGFVIDGRDVVVPMAVEESSVIAAASHGAKLAAVGGGFRTHVAAQIQPGQLEIRCSDEEAAIIETHVAGHKDVAIERLNGLVPSMVRRGGGLVDIQTYRVAGRVVVRLDVDVQDAMGANVVNTLCEAAWDALEIPAGRAGLRILTNDLGTQRHATADVTIPYDALGGRDVAAAMVEAWEFSQVDPARAATHNKGIMNGIDPVVIASGNDWRAIEAGAHAFAARDGYRGLGRYTLADDGLACALSVPLALGTVGGVTRLHPVAQACLKVMGAGTAQQLASVVVATGLAQNISALKALATEGIQRGHMSLHARNIAMQAGLTGDAAARVAEQMAAEGDVSVSRARELSE